MVRSDKYEPVTVVMPSDGESIEMYSIISFDTGNLNQINAAMDDIAYTNDDIFVFAPNYWERVKIRLEIH